MYAGGGAGIIGALRPLPDASQLIAQNGRPGWKINASFTWRHGPWRVGASSQYVSEVFQTGLLSATGQPWKVTDQTTVNLYGQYTFDERFGAASDTELRIGVRDLTDEGPSLADNGYLGSVQRPYGRYWYVDISKTF